MVFIFRKRFFGKCSQVQKAVMTSPEIFTAYLKFLMFGVSAILFHLIQKFSEFFALSIFDGLAAVFSDFAYLLRFSRKFPMASMNIFTFIKLVFVVRLLWSIAIHSPCLKAKEVSLKQSVVHFLLLV